MRCPFFFGWKALPASWGWQNPLPACRPSIASRPFGTELYLIMAKLTVRDLEVTGKRVFLRVDYNVPMEEKNGRMVINDDTRIRETLPTLKLLLEKGAPGVGGASGAA